MNKTMTAVLVVVALLVGAFGGYYFEKVHATANMESYKMMVQTQMDAAKKMADQKMMQEKDAMMKLTPTPSGAMTKTGEAMSPKPSEVMAK